MDSVSLAQRRCRMEKYVLLLRGINVGGKNKVNMDELKRQLFSLGYTDIISYINSGNLLFCSDQEIAAVKESLFAMFTKHYHFPILFALIPQILYLQDAGSLPSWWYEDMARKDVLFFTDSVNREDTRRRIDAMKLGNEKIHFGKTAIYWGKYSMDDYSKTAYAKYVLSQPFYKQVTIRNGNTYHKILSLINEMRNE